MVGRNIQLLVNELIYLLLFNTKYKAFQIPSCINNAEMVLYPDNFISTIKDDIMHGAYTFCLSTSISVIDGYIIELEMSHSYFASL